MSEFLDAIASGDRRTALTALRDVLAESLDDLHGSIKTNSGLCRRCGGSLSEAGLAALAQRLKMTLDDLEALGDPAKPKSVLDQLQEKRNERAGQLGTKHAERRKGTKRDSPA